MSSDQPSNPTGRLWRGIAVVAGVAVILVVAVLAGAVVYREDVAHAVLQDRLRGLGIEDARFRVEQVTTRSIAIAGFSSGEALSFERLTVGFSVGDVLRGRVARIELTGLHMDLTQPGPWARFRRNGDDTAGPRIDQRFLPTVDVRRARLRFAIPTGLMTVTVGATLRPEGDGELAFQAQASAAGPPGNVDVAYEGTIRVGARGGATASGRLRVTSMVLAAGRAAFKSLKVELPMSVAVTTAGVTATVHQGARFETRRVELETGVSMGPISGSVTGSLSSAPSSGGWFGATAEIFVDAREIRADFLAAERFAASLPIRIDAGPENVTIIFAREGRLTLDGVRLARNAPATKVSSTISGRIGLSWSVDDSGASAGIAVDHELSIGPAPITIPGPTEVRVTLGKIETSGALAADGAYIGRVLIDTSRFARGNWAMAATGIAVRLTTGAGLAAPIARITVDALRGVSPASGSGTYAVAATVRQTGGGVAYRADFGGLGMRRLAAVAGFHDFAQRAGHAEVSIPDITLGPAGVQPDTVIPALSAIHNVAGRIGGDARLAWRNGRVTGRAKLRLDGIGGETDGGIVEGISGTIVFDRLFPPSTASAQRLRIKKINAGVVLTGTSIRFALLPSGVLRIGRADATLADGKVIVVAPIVDLVAQKARATVTLQGVRLERILSLVDLGDVYATGRIYGSVPIRIAGANIAIDGGALAALGGGALRFRSERAKQVLKTGGKQVALMLQALEDFTYERLNVNIDKSPAGDARVMLRTLGHNPAVLEGRKFQININLETNLNRLLEAAMQWYRLSGKALRDIVRPGTRKGAR